MSYPVETDVIRRVQNEDGETLDIRPWPDAPIAVALMNSGGDKSEAYFGKLELALSPKFARQIGQALINCANEIEYESKDP